MRFVAFDSVGDNKRRLINPMQVSQVYEGESGRTVILVGSEHLLVSVKVQDAVNEIEKAIAAPNR